MKKYRPVIADNSKYSTEKYNHRIRHPQMHRNETFHEITDKDSQSCLHP